MRVARPVVLDKQGQRALEQLARGRSLPARLVERARIVLQSRRWPAGSANRIGTGDHAGEGRAMAQPLSGWWNRGTRKRCVATRQAAYNHRVPHPPK